MRIVASILVIVLAPFVLKAQDLEGSYNPYVGSGEINPAPLWPKEKNGTGSLSFVVGNAGDDPLEVYSGGNHMSLILSLSYGEPDHAEALAALGGNASIWFSWNYDPETLTYTATQVSTIAAGSSDLITIAYRVSQNSPYNALNGFHVNIQPAPYHQNSNNSSDDAVSSYTYTDADAVGVSENKMPGMGIYPNPGSQFYLDLKGVDSYRIEVINYHGNIVEELSSEKDINLHPIDLKHLAPGLYLLRVYTTHSIVTKRIVVVH